MARTFVTQDMVNHDVRTAVAFVEKKRKWTNERNRKEAELLGWLLDTMTREVSGGDMRYLLGTETMEIIVRRLTVLMTVDGQPDAREAWKIAQAIMAPVQRTPGVYLDPAAWQSAAKASKVTTSSSDASEEKATA